LENTGKPDIISSPARDEWEVLRSECLYVCLSAGIGLSQKPHIQSSPIFTARRSYARAVLGVVILSVRPSVRLSHACFVTNPKNLYRRYFYTTWKGNPASQVWFFVQLCSSWQDFNWLKASRGPSAIAELLVLHTLRPSLEAMQRGGASAMKLRPSMPCLPLTDILRP